MENVVRVGCAMFARVCVCLSGLFRQTIQNIRQKYLVSCIRPYSVRLAHANAYLPTPSYMAHRSHRVQSKSNQV